MLSGPSIAERTFLQSAIIMQQSLLTCCLLWLRPMALVVGKEVVELFLEDSVCVFRAELGPAVYSRSGSCMLHFQDVISCEYHRGNC